MTDRPCNREWDAEGVGLLACDLKESHAGAHLCAFGGRIHTAPNLDVLEERDA